jgi:hypothetical protein
MRGETIRERNALSQRRRAHSAKRERPGRKARAFTLSRSACQFRARLVK